MERADFDQWKAREVARLLALVESERRYYQELVALLPVPLAILSADGFIASANRAFRQFFDLSGEDMRRTTIERLLPAPELAAKLQQAQAGAVAPFTLNAIVAGTQRTLRATVTPVRDWSDENSIEILLVIEELGSPVASPATLPEQLPAVVWQADAASLRFQSVQGSVERVSGFPPAHWTGHPQFFAERIYTEDRERVLALYRAAIEAGEEASAEFRMVCPSGSLIWARETVRASGSTISGVITDISHRKELERQILASSRIDALRRISGRLAHDLNNPLMIAQGYAEEILQSLPEEDARRHDANEILKAGERISSLTAQLIEFGRPQVRPAASLELGAMLPAMQGRVANIMGVRASVELTPPGYSVFASADRGQLEEALLALCTARANAPGLTRLTVSWYAESISESVPGSMLAPGRYACITLRDNGRGLDEAQRESLFEVAGTPLARAYAAIREWGGTIAVENDPQGNKLTIYLASVNATERKPAPAAAPESAPPLEPLRETVLVVDDEAGIRGLIRKILTRERYNVLEAASADEALMIARSHAGPIHLLLSDVLMPGLTGPELARRMSEASPDLKVLFISGYTGEESTLPEQMPPGFAFLQKPFTLRALVGKVRQTLDS